MGDAKIFTSYENAYVFAIDENKITEIKRSDDNEKYLDPQSIVHSP